MRIFEMLGTRISTFFFFFSSISLKMISYSTDLLASKGKSFSFLLLRKKEKIISLYYMEKTNSMKNDLYTINKRKTCQC